jgi:ribulose-phosphate 3-epimerase
VLEEIRQSGAAAGLALNPPTPLSAIEPLLDACDLVLVMSVMPGFGGQKFDAIALEKLSALKKIVGPDVLLEVDGGVKTSNIAKCTEAGAQLLVVGSAIFDGGNYAANTRELMRLVSTH